MNRPFSIIAVVMNSPVFACHGLAFGRRSEESKKRSPRVAEMSWVTEYPAQLSSILPFFDSPGAAGSFPRPAIFP
jgi:hypothetical protein